MSKKLTAIVLGYGSRGSTYCSYSLAHPEQIEVVGVAEPIDERRESAVNKFAIPESNVFTDWKQVCDVPRLADFAIISMQDNMHYEPALAMIEKGYNLLLEKPMAVTASQCKAISEAAEKKGVKVVVCHVLRFTDFWNTLKDIIDDGEIGDIVSIIHMENVGNLHQSHSYVRGNWRRTEESTPMILAKSCHDMDILQWLVGKECKRVQSFGSLTHFTKENQPQGAADRCLECPLAAECIYDAKRFYLSKSTAVTWKATVTNTPNDTVPTDEQIVESLRTGPYGRCVYACDNDVVDHQVVNLEFEGGATASFTMNAFNAGGRYIRVFGTKGEIVAAMHETDIDVFSFATRKHKIHKVTPHGEHIEAGHGGGDTGIMQALYKYFNDEPAGKGICTIRTSYLNHAIAYAAEESRLEGTVIDMAEYETRI